MDEALFSGSNDLRRRVSSQISSLEFFFEAFIWTNFVSSSIHELSLHDTPGHAVVLHVADIPHPSGLGFDEYGINTGGVSAL